MLGLGYSTPQFGPPIFCSSKDESQPGICSFFPNYFCGVGGFRIGFRISGMAFSHCTANSSVNSVNVLKPRPIPHNRSSNSSSWGCGAADPCANPSVRRALMGIEWVTVAIRRKMRATNSHNPANSPKPQTLNSSPNQQWQILVTHRSPKHKTRKLEILYLNTKHSITTPKP